MPDPIPDLPPIGGGQTRKEKRKTLKKLKRKRIRKEAAIREREEEKARLNDPQEQLRINLKEEEEVVIAERGRREFEEREKLWIEEVERRKEEEERRRQKLIEESERWKTEHTNELEDDDEWDYAEDGPAEIIWKGNEIILKKKRVKVAKKAADRKPDYEDVDRPTSNPLPPQSVAFSSYNSEKSLTAQELLEGVAQQVPNFGTEQDKAHCPFHLKTGACRFGSRCSRVHFYPDKSCTLLIKSMYNGPGLAWDQDEGLEYTDEEVERCYEEFYEDVHTEFLKFGELVNFKVCKNGSYHLRGNVYAHYKSLESAVLAYNTVNGRYFAGKQMEGRHMRRIHEIKAKGDYEWADWDNPPPQYWIRKMAVLFGPSDELSYGKQMELEDFENRRDSSRKYHSKRSPRDEMKVHDRQRDRRGSHSRRDDSERRKETSFRDKSEESHESQVYDYDTRNHQKHKRSRRKEEKSERKHKLKSVRTQREEIRKESDEFSDYGDDGSKLSIRQSSEDFYFSRHGINAQDRYDSGKDSSNQNGSRHYKSIDHNIKCESNDGFSDRWDETHDHSCDGNHPSHWKTTRSHKRTRKQEINSSCSDEESDRR